ncbi:MAG: OsmC family protein [Gammaproteobacteria bacterium]|mgnify:FL=1|jgi:putative redox protein|nr:OsmC family protein [Gammaproteobacteria bacterium]MBT6043640.1 OsmC family protein [Gammaproteobacteria bacterium]
MKATITWQEEAMFEGVSGSGHKVIMDGPESAGGKNRGARPMEMLLLGVGTCSAFDVVNILKKSRQDVTDCITEVDAQRADAVPAVFEKIHLSFKVSGNNLDPAKVKRAVDLSAEKYCSASIMLSRAGVEMSHDFIIEESATQD